MIRQAILTRFIGPTDHRGSRIKASAAAGSHTWEYDHSLDGPTNHQSAMRVFVHLKGWNEWGGRWAGGQLPSGDYAWVWSP